jgi:hypothetical protein
MDTTLAGVEVVIRGYSGDDTVILRHIGDSTYFEGGGGDDHLTVDIPGDDPTDPAHGNLFNDLLVDIERLIVDNHLNPNPVEWIVGDGKLSAGPYDFLVTEGAGELRILAGQNSGSTLEVVEADGQVTIDGNRIELVRGTSGVLQQTAWNTEITVPLSVDWHPVLIAGLNSTNTNGFPFVEADGSYNGFRLVGEGGGDESGYAVSSVGDVNGDGIADFIIGAKGANTCYVVFGGAGNLKSLDVMDNAPSPDGVIYLAYLDGSNGFRLEGNDGGGQSVSLAGDVNGDGVDDLIIGEPGTGTSYVVLGRDLDQGDAPFPGSLDLTNLSSAEGFSLVGAADAGYAVSSAGDVNGDGVDDLIIGAPGANNGVGVGYVVFGKDTEEAGDFGATMDLGGLNGTNGFRLDGVEAGDLSGWSVSSAGDVNNDGIADLIIGAPGTDSAYVVFGESAGFDSSLSLDSLNGSDGFRLDGVTGSQ